MGLVQKFSEARERLVLRHAEPHLQPDERVVQWARTKAPEGHQDGFIFLTDDRAIVYWEDDGTSTIGLPDVVWWRMEERPHGGPILEFRTSDGTTGNMQFPVHTRRRARDVANFLEAFVDLAPWPKRAQADADGEGFLTRERPSLRVRRERASTKAFARRIVVTTVGVALILTGIVLIPGPGPWSFLINIGGLAVLASEYDWAKDLLTWSREKFEQAKSKVKKSKNSSSSA